jgi:hypothetical protein
MAFTRALHAATSGLEIRDSRGLQEKTRATRLGLGLTCAGEERRPVETILSSGDLRVEKKIHAFTPVVSGTSLDCTREE